MQHWLYIIPHLSYRTLSFLVTGTEIPAFSSISRDSAWYVHTKALAKSLLPTPTPHSHRTQFLEGATPFHAAAGRMQHGAAVHSKGARVRLPGFTYGPASY